jgi:pimeloyl-ACP methyl ester carboxylesterase
MASKALAVIRPMMQFGSIIAPGITGRLAFDLFCRTQNPRRLPEKQRDLIDRAEQRLGQATASMVDYADGKIMIYDQPAKRPQPRGTVVLLHGWASRAALMSGFMEALSEAGFRTIAVDLPGHGRSSGRSLHIARAEDRP